MTSPTLPSERILDVGEERFRLDELEMFVSNFANADDEDDEWNGRDMFRDWREKARTLCDRRPSPPSGDWVLVPREPTEEMVKATAPAFKEVADMVVYCHARGSHPGGLSKDPVPDAYRAMIAASPAPPPVEDEWQPIETAPRNGTRFLAYEDGNHYALEWVPETPREGHWKCFCGQYVTLSPEPTHWRPLPLPPVGNGSSNASPSAAPASGLRDAAEGGE